MEIEKEVILLMSQGDEKAYGIMFRKFYPKVHRFVSMLLKNMDDADDVCQIIFEKIWRKRQKFAEIKDFDSYLFILAKIPLSIIFPPSEYSDRHRFLA